MNITREQLAARVQHLEAQRLQVQLQATADLNDLAGRISETRALLAQLEQPAPDLPEPEPDPSPEAPE